MAAVVVKRARQVGQIKLAPKCYSFRCRYLLITIALGSTSEFLQHGLVAMSGRRHRYLHHLWHAPRWRDNRRKRDIGPPTRDNAGRAQAPTAVAVAQAAHPN